jgi:dTMP kinase
VLFSSSLLLLGGGLIALASMGSLDPAIPIVSALGFFGGVAYSTAYSLIQATTRDELRGRTFSAAYTVIRIGTLVGLGIFPLIAGSIGDHSLSLGGGTYPLPGTRLTLWFAGLFVLGGGVLSMRAIRARVPVPEAVIRPGFFVVFEGGEGAGKSTQMEAFTRWLEARGDDFVTTREPGGTAIGTRIRDILLDERSSEMDPRTESLLYAADRAQHAAEVILPALLDGKIVVSDRFVDSSLAYQGHARGLGVDDILNISSWGTSGLMPDLVFWLKVDPDKGLQRIDSQRDRIEGENDEFHRKVAVAYEELARRFPERFVVIEADRPPEQVHRDIVTIYQDRIRIEGAIPLPSPETPLPR